MSASTRADKQQDSHGGAGAQTLTGGLGASGEPGKQTLTSAVSPVQANTGDLAGEDAGATAERGVAGASAQLPHLDRIQQSFGRHDVSGVRAEVGGPAADAG